MTVSVMLQSGTAVEAVVKLLSEMSFAPDGRVFADMTDVKRCKSVTDWIAQEIDAVYVKKTSTRPTTFRGRRPDPSPAEKVAKLTVEGDEGRGDAGSESQE